MPYNRSKPTPKTARQALNESIPEIVSGSKPVENYEIKRSEQISVKDSTTRDYSIGFDNIDDAILYYFNNVIKPSVIENGTIVNVPVMFANPERWKSAQVDGGIRDKDGKIQFPVIALKKDSIEKVRDITNKLDGNKVHNYHIYQQKYTKENHYDNFSVLNNKKPAKEYKVLIVPDYYTINYSCAVYVNKVNDINKILESVLYASYSYWGDPKRFTFMAMIDDAPITQEINEGENRKIYSVFTIKLNGHIISDSVNKYMSIDTSKFFSKSKFTLTSEVVDKL